MKKFEKALRKLDKRQDEFHDSNLTAIVYTSDGDMYHIKAAGEYSENDIVIEGVCYGNAIKPCVRMAVALTHLRMVAKLCNP